MKLFGCDQKSFSRTLGLTTIFLGFFGIGSFVVPDVAQATILNGGFESGFNNWSTAGDASIQGVGFGSGPTEGNSQALLTNSSSLDNDGLNFSSVDPLTVGVAGGLESFLSLTPGSLDPDPNNFIIATEGSALKQTFTGQAGDVLSLDWNFLTNDTQDYAFILLSPVNDLGSVTYNDLIRLDNSNTLVNSNTAFTQETGFQSFSYSLPSDGTYLLGFGVVDVGDTEISSGVLIDNISLSGGSTRTPEPGSPASLLCLVLLGLGTKVFLGKNSFK